MFVAIDEENKQVFGPFSNEEKGQAWALAYIEKVEDDQAWNRYIDEHIGDNEAEMDFTGSIDDFLTNRLWNIQEVAFVDEDDREFVAFSGRHTFVAPNDARPTLCAFVYLNGDRCLQPRGNDIHVQG